MFYVHDTCFSLTDEGTYFQYCTIDACTGDHILATTCSGGGECTGDTYFRLYDATGEEEVAYNDDWCGLCSNLAWTVDVAGCESFILEPGCYDGGHDCGGIISVTVTAPPSDDFYSDDFYSTDDNWYNFYTYNHYAESSFKSFQVWTCMAAL